MKKLTFLISSILCLGIGTLYAQYDVLHNFNDTLGGGPNGDLVISANTLYGMAGTGGKHKFGCVFSINTNGSGYKDLLDFDSINGANPYGGLTLSGNTLYGVTQEGGANGVGLIFSIQTNGTGYADLYDFQNGLMLDNGMQPGCTLVLSDNMLYGIAYSGGKNGIGVIFSVSTSGSGYLDMLDFNGTNGSPGETNTLIMSGNILYGVASGGGANGYGCIFSIANDGTNYKDMHDFNDTDGANPVEGLVLLGNVLYGTCGSGFIIGGNIFSINTDGSDYRVLYDFNNYLNGYNPYGSLIISGGVLYGMTSQGGPNGNGNIFSINTNGTGYKNLFDFDETDGSHPWGTLTLSGNVLYGTTTQGGIDSDGVVFSINNMGAGVDEVAANTAFVNVYPNPSSGAFTISIRNEELGMSNNVEVYNVLGEKVYSTPSTPSPNGEGWVRVIDLRNQPNGIYLYRVIATNGELIGEGKLVIQK